MFSFIKTSFCSPFKIICILFFFAVITACKFLYAKEYSKPKIVDNEPNLETKKLHKKFFLSSKKSIVIGHQDATSFGIGWEHDQTNQVNIDVR